ncbi:MAG: segregation/condensation protein A [Clostridia bacterium]|nr:segregation/condensation protein A [Clostridia bacterium]
MTFQFQDFDGPLDLLLQMIQKAKIDIHDIFVSEITDQYIEYIHQADFLDMDEATDFLVMASTLLEIKSRAMLPKPPRLEEGEEDPEEALIRRLEEYKRFRETAEEMKVFEKTARDLLTKLPDEFPLPPQETELVGLTLDGLVAAMQRILERRPAEDESAENNHYAPRDIHRDEHTVQECMLTLTRAIRKSSRMRFEEAFSEAPTKEEVVTFFLALLELLRMGEMYAEQDHSCAEIFLVRGRRPESAQVEEEELPGKRRRRRNKAGKEREDDGDGNPGGRDADAGASSGGSGDEEGSRDL